MKNLEPKVLWNRFADICAIPHPSKHEAAIRQYIIKFAKDRSLKYREDKVGNIVVCKPATKGFEKRPTVILQAHMDMVPQKNSDKKFDFTKDAIETYVDGEWLKAKGTTLGSDNGIGCAAMLAVLESKDIEHPAIEALFTIDEETGLTGANGLAKNMLTGTLLINLDSEDEGELYVGCAGAVNNTATLKYKEESVPADMKGYAIEIKGLKGGHSGMEIILQRANANKLVVRFMREQAAKNGLRISTIDGGGLRNAIPREANATVVVPKDKAKAFEQEAKAFNDQIIKEYSFVEENMSFSVKETKSVKSVVTKRDQKKIIISLTAAPNGIFRMSDSMIGLVETSTNMSRVSVVGGQMEVLFMSRCMVNYGKRELVAMIHAAFEGVGGKVKDENDYDGWAPNMKSPLLKAMKEGYKKLYGKTPEVRAIHAGLECGIIGAKYPELDMISMGPTIRFPHSPDEKVNIPTVEKFYKFLLYTLTKI